MEALQKKMLQNRLLISLIHASNGHKNVISNLMLTKHIYGLLKASVNQKSPHKANAVDLSLFK